jgi:hypothetical protein
MKEWYEAHKNEIKDKYKELYKVNKEKLCEKFNCDCGGKYTFGHKSNHEKTKKHLLFINQQL